MNVVSALVLFTVVWFVTLLVALPIGVRTQGEAGEVVPGTPASAPVDAMIRRKMLWVTVVFIELPNTKIELLHPFGPASPVSGFLEKNPSGGIHHICYEVDDILAARDTLKAAGARVLGDGEPRIGAHGKPVLFLHPKDFTGTLVELEQA